MYDGTSEISFSKAKLLKWGHLLTLIINGHIMSLCQDAYYFLSFMYTVHMLYNFLPSC